MIEVAAAPPAGSESGEIRATGILHCGVEAMGLETSGCTATSAGLATLPGRFAIGANPIVGRPGGATSGTPGRIDDTERCCASEGAGISAIPSAAISAFIPSSIGVIPHLQYAFGAVVALSLTQVYLPSMIRARAAALRWMVFSLAFAAAASLPHVAGAQDHWTGIGAINGTVMYMDTTSIQRIGSLRKVWIRSLDLSPKTVMVGTDSLTFDTVVALNVFDCSSGTRTVAQVRYLLGPDSVFDVTNDHGEPEKLRPTSFFGAIYSDVCRSPGKSGSR